MSLPRLLSAIASFLKHTRDKEKRNWLIDYTTQEKLSARHPSNICAHVILRRLFLCFNCALKHAPLFCMASKGWRRRDVALSPHNNLRCCTGDKRFCHNLFPYLSSLLLKGTVSRELRPMLPYIIGKLFSRPIVALLKIFILLKGQFAMYIKQFSVS